MIVAMMLPASAAAALPVRPADRRAARPRAAAGDPRRRLPGPVARGRRRACTWATSASTGSSIAGAGSAAHRGRHRRGGARRGRPLPAQPAQAPLRRAAAARPRASSAPLARPLGARRDAGAWPSTTRPSCVGCCWALMLVMFAVGVGSLVLMAGLTVVMVAEKTHELGRRLSTPVAIVAARRRRRGGARRIGGSDMAAARHLPEDPAAQRLLAGRARRPRHAARALPPRLHARAGPRGRDDPRRRGERAAAERARSTASTSTRSTWCPSPTS